MSTLTYWMTRKSFSFTISQTLRTSCQRWDSASSVQSTTWTACLSNRMKPLKWRQNHLRLPNQPKKMAKSNHPKIRKRRNARKERTQKCQLSKRGVCTSGFYRTLRTPIPPKSRNRSLAQIPKYPYRRWITGSSTWEKEHSRNWWVEKIQALPRRRKAKKDPITKNNSTTLNR